ncbi:MAG TPA: hypothetical protein VIM81_03480 [Gammaproteobacteria bacterium]
MPLDGSELVRHISNAAVVGYRDAGVSTDVLQPLFVSAARGKQIIMTLDLQSRSREDLGKALT